MNVIFKSNTIWIASEPVSYFILKNEFEYGFNGDRVRKMFDQYRNEQTNFFSKNKPFFSAFSLSNEWKLIWN